MKEELQKQINRYLFDTEREEIMPKPEEFNHVMNTINEVRFKLVRMFPYGQHSILQAFEDLYTKLYNIEEINQPKDQGEDQRTAQQKVADSMAILHERKTK